MLAVSVLRDYTLIWRADSALKSDGEDFAAAWERALATREWAAILRPGSTPTVFHVRQLPGPLWRRLQDYVSDKANRVGPIQFPALAFSLAVTAIDNFDGKVERVDHVDGNGKPTGLGLVLSPETMAALDTVPDLVTDLGVAILEARANPHPL